jgi:chemotaxis signal transduction protein
VSVDPRVAALRAEFDASFAAPSGSGAVALDKFLALRVAGERYAIRLAFVQSVHRDRPIVAIPRSPADFLGVAGFRGALAPVYDLASCLGHRAAPAARWLLLTKSPVVGLAIEGFESYFEATHEESADRGAFTGIARAPDGPRPIIDVEAVLAAIARRQPLPLQEEP